METYTTTQLQALIGVTHTTIKKRAKFFAKFLSPSATPPDGKKRRFTAEDVRVLATVESYVQRGYGWEDAYLALEQGERVEVPTSNELLIADKDLTEMEIMELKAQVTKLTDQYKMALGQNVLLKEQLADKERQIQELYRQIALLEARNIKQ